MRELKDIHGMLSWYSAAWYNKNCWHDMLSEFLRICLMVFLLNFPRQVEGDGYNMSLLGL